MKTNIRPYLHFDGNCKEAMGFYKNIFGGQLILMSIGESPAKQHFPKEIHHEILHGSLINEDFNLLSSDMCGSGILVKGNQFQLSLNCESEEEIQTLYHNLSEGGSIVQELGEVFWGGLFAMVKDRFDVQWMLSFEMKS